MLGVRGVLGVELGVVSAPLVGTGGALVVPAATRLVIGSARMASQAARVTVIVVGYGARGVGSVKTAASGVVGRTRSMARESAV